MLTSTFKLMPIFRKQFILLFLVIFLVQYVSAQQGDSNDISVPSAEWTVQNHKEQLKLTLLIDSIQIGKKIWKLNFQRTLDINFESDYLQVKDSIYIRIFIARNQEYGKKFYSWKWDYLEKKDGKYNKLGSSYYAPMNFNQPIQTIGNYGEGIGTEGESDYLMFFYRYRLE